MEIRKRVGQAGVAKDVGFVPGPKAFIKRVPRCFFLERVLPAGPALEERWNEVLGHYPITFGAEASVGPNEVGNIF